MGSMLYATKRPTLTTRNKRTTAEADTHLTMVAVDVKIFVHGHHTNCLIGILHTTINAKLNIRILLSAFKRTQYIHAVSYTHLTLPTIYSV